MCALGLDSGLDSGLPSCSARRRCALAEGGTPAVPTPSTQVLRLYHPEASQRELREWVRWAESMQLGRIHSNSNAEDREEIKRRWAEIDVTGRGHIQLQQLLDADLR